MNKNGFFIVESCVFISFFLLGLHVVLHSFTLVARMQATLDAMGKTCTTVIPLQHRILEDMHQAIEIVCQRHTCTCSFGDTMVIYTLKNEKLTRSFITQLQGRSTTTLESGVTDFLCQAAPGVYCCAITTKTGGTHTEGISLEY